MRRRVVLTALIALATTAVGLCGYRELKHVRRKATITRVVVMGQLCEQLKPTAVDHESLLRAIRSAGHGDFDREDLQDGWGKPIFVRRSPDGLRYTVWAFGEAKVTSNVDDAPYLWEGKTVRTLPYLH